MCFSVRVDALGNLMNFVGPFGVFNRSFAVTGRQHRWNRQTVRAQMRHETMLLEQPFPIAHRAVMTLYEDSTTAYRDNARRRKRTWADCHDLEGFIDSRILL